MTHVPAVRLRDLSTVGPGVDALLREFLDQKVQAAPGPEMTPLITTLRRFVSGGKRLRAQLCVAGWHVGNGYGDGRAALCLAAALELFQAFALIHDDVMDASDLRRGRPAAHCTLAAAYIADGGRHSHAQAFGENAAILLGDVSLVWSDELLHSAGLDAETLLRTQLLLADMRSELVYGQYLDLLCADRLSDDVEAALRVVRYKTAKYSMDWPLRLGAVLAGASLDVLDACSAFALPLGEAFQLRDDLLGTFGDPAETGKPVGDDIREGKATVLMALAVQRASTAEKQLLQTLVGRRDLAERDLQRVRSILEESGARQHVEKMISARRNTALAALDRAPFSISASTALREIAESAAQRHS